jgi:hypothetical protein
MDDEDIEMGKPTLSTLAAWNGVDFTRLAIEARLDPLWVWEMYYSRRMETKMLYRLLQALNRLMQAQYSFSDISR